MITMGESIRDILVNHNKKSYFFRFDQYVPVLLSRDRKFKSETVLHWTGTHFILRKLAHAKYRKFFSAVKIENFM